VRPRSPGRHATPSEKPRHPNHSEVPMARHEVLTPVPGTFYRRPDPDADAFKHEGDSVAAGETVGLVEIMKNFQEVKAEANGRLVEYLVGNEDSVSAGQPVAILEDDA
jgi:acetyl-CoA carboxylase biotin carboxyl carrier protein